MSDKDDDLDDMGLGDDDFDLGDMDIDFNDSESVSMDDSDSSDRNTVSGIATGGLTSFVDDFTDDKLDTVLDVAKAAIPTSLSAETDVVVDTYTNISDMVSKQGGAVRDGARKGLQTIKKLLPANDDGFLNKVVNKVSGWVGEDEGSRRTAGPTQSELISNEINELLGQQSSAEDADAKFKEQLAFTQNQELKTIQATESVNVERIRKYMFEVTDKYYRSSLDVNLRQLFVMKELLDVTKLGFDIFKSALNDVVKNTSLPDFAKVNNAEMIKKALSEKAMSVVGGALYKKGSTIEQLGTKITGAAKTLGESAVNTIASATDNVESMTALTDTPGMTPTSMITSLLSSMAKEKMGKFVGDKISKTEDGSNAIYKVMSAFADPDTFLKEMSSKGGLGGTVADVVSNHTSSGVSNFKVERKDLSSAAALDNRTIDSINKVIPKLLSKIYGEVKSSRELTLALSGKQGKLASRKLGTPESNEVIYDPRTEGFITRKELKTSIASRAKESVTANVAKPADIVVREFLTDAKKDFSQEDFKAIRDELVNIVMSKGSTSTEVFKDKKFIRNLKKINPELSSKVTAQYKVFRSRVKVDSDITRSVNNTLKTMVNAKTDHEDIARDLVDRGLTNEAIDSGLITREKDGSIVGNIKARRADIISSAQSSKISEAEIKKPSWVEETAGMTAWEKAKYGVKKTVDDAKQKALGETPEQIKARGKDEKGISEEPKGDTSLPGFARGGFTSIGGKNAVAGIVHKGEYVLNKKVLTDVRQSVADGNDDAVLRVAEGIANDVNTRVAASANKQDDDLAKAKKVSLVKQSKDNTLSSSNKKSPLGTSRVESLLAQLVSVVKGDDKKVDSKEPAKTARFSKLTKYVDSKRKVVNDAIDVVTKPRVSITELVDGVSKTAESVYHKALKAIRNSTVVITKKSLAADTKLKKQDRRRLATIVMQLGANEGKPFTAETLDHRMNSIAMRHSDRVLYTKYLNKKIAKTNKPVATAKRIAASTAKATKKLIKTELAGQTSSEYIEKQFKKQLDKALDTSTTVTAEMLESDDKLPAGDKSRLLAVVNAIGDNKGKSRSPKELRNALDKAKVSYADSILYMTYIKNHPSAKKQLADKVSGAWSTTVVKANKAIKDADGNDNTLGKAVKSATKLTKRVTSIADGTSSLTKDADGNDNTLGKAVNSTVKMGKSLATIKTMPSKKLIMADKNLSDVDKKRLLKVVAAIGNTTNNRFKKPHALRDKMGKLGIDYSEQTLYVKYADSLADVKTTDKIKEGIASIALGVPNLTTDADGNDTRIGKAVKRVTNLTTDADGNDTKLGKVVKRVTSIADGTSSLTTDADGNDTTLGRIKKGVTKAATDSKKQMLMIGVKDILTDKTLPPEDVSTLVRVANMIKPHIGKTYTAVKIAEILDKAGVNSDDAALYEQYTAFKSSANNTAVGRGMKLLTGVSDTIGSEVNRKVDLGDASYIDDSEVLKTARDTYAKDIDSSVEGFVSVWDDLTESEQATIRFEFFASNEYKTKEITSFQLWLRDLKRIDPGSLATRKGVVFTSFANLKHKLMEPITKLKEELLQAALEKLTGTGLKELTIDQEGPMRKEFFASEEHKAGDATDFDEWLKVSGYKRNGTGILGRLKHSLNLRTLLKKTRALDRKVMGAVYKGAGKLLYKAPVAIAKGTYYAGKGGLAGLGTVAKGLGTTGSLLNRGGNFIGNRLPTPGVPSNLVGHVAHGGMRAGLAVARGAGGIFKDVVTDTVGAIPGLGVLNGDTRPAAITRGKANVGKSIEAVGKVGSKITSLRNRTRDTVREPMKEVVDNFVPTVKEIATDITGGAKESTDTATTTTAKVKAIETIAKAKQATVDVANKAKEKSLQTMLKFIGVSEDKSEDKKDNEDTKPKKEEVKTNTEKVVAAVKPKEDQDKNTDRPLLKYFKRKDAEEDLDEKRQDQLDAKAAKKKAKATKRANFFNMFDKEEDLDEQDRAKKPKKKSIMGKILKKADSLITPTTILLGLGATLAAVGVTLDGIKEGVNGTWDVIKTVAKYTTLGWDGFKDLIRISTNMYTYTKQIPERLGLVIDNLTSFGKPSKSNVQKLAQLDSMMIEKEVVDHSQAWYSSTGKAFDTNSADSVGSNTGGGTRSGTRGGTRSGAQGGTRGGKTDLNGWRNGTTSSARVDHNGAVPWRFDGAGKPSGNDTRQDYLDKSFYELERFVRGDKIAPYTPSNNNDAPAQQGQVGVSNGTALKVALGVGAAVVAGSVLRKGYKIGSKVLDVTKAVTRIGTTKKAKAASAGKSVTAKTATETAKAVASRAKPVASKTAKTIASRAKTIAKTAAKTAKAVASRAKTIASKIAKTIARVAKPASVGMRDKLIKFMSVLKNRIFLKLGASGGAKVAVKLLSKLAGPLGWVLLAYSVGQAIYLMTVKNKSFESAASLALIGVDLFDDSDEIEKARIAAENGAPLPTEVADMIAANDEATGSHKVSALGAPSVKRPSTVSTKSISNVPTHQSSNEKSSAATRAEMKYDKSIKALSKPAVAPTPIVKVEPIIKISPIINIPTDKNIVVIADMTSKSVDIQGEMLTMLGTISNQLDRNMTPDAPTPSISGVQSQLPTPKIQLGRRTAF